MRIGIIGAGKVGGGVGKLWVRAGHQVFFSSRHPNRLKVLVEEAGSGRVIRKLSVILEELKSVNPTGALIAQTKKRIKERT
jgi:predicted dinucleotide-binding enzyme